MVDMLHNMSMRPSTRVQWGLSALWERPACFELKRCGPPKGFGRLDWEELHRLAHDRWDHLLERMEHDWEKRAFTGAVLMYTGSCDDFPGMMHTQIYARDLSYVTDPLLVLNVLCRTRGGVLLHDAPAYMDRDRLERSLVTFDPRFVPPADRSGRNRGLV